nr:unnamed protein product [Digitaria exilis]
MPRPCSGEEKGARAAPSPQLLAGGRGTGPVDGEGLALQEAVAAAHRKAADFAPNQGESRPQQRRVATAAKEEDRRRSRRARAARRRGHHQERGRRENNQVSNQA